MAAWINTHVKIQVDISIFWLSMSLPVTDFVDFFFLIQFYVPFKIISAHMRRGKSVGRAKTGEPQEKPPDTSASKTWLVSHVARAGLEPTPVTAVR